MFRFQLGRGSFSHTSSPKKNAWPQSLRNRPCSRKKEKNPNFFKDYLCSYASCLSPISERLVLPFNSKDHLKAGCIICGRFQLVSWFQQINPNPNFFASTHLIRESATNNELRVEVRSAQASVLSRYTGLSITSLHTGRPKTRFRKPRNIWEMITRVASGILEVKHLPMGEWSSGNRNDKVEQDYFVAKWLNLSNHHEEYQPSP